MLTIDLDELTLALNSRDPLGECSYWLNIGSGMILSRIGTDADHESDEDPRHEDRWLFIEPIEVCDACQSSYMFPHLRCAALRRQEAS